MKLIGEVMREEDCPHVELMFHRLHDGDVRKQSRFAASQWRAVKHALKDHARRA